MPETPTEKLANLVRQKRRLLEQLCAIGRRQGELIERGDIQTLLKLLSGKQQLIAAVHAIERALEPYRHDDPESRSWASSQHRSECAADAQECSRLLAEVVCLEQQHERVLSERRDAVSSQMRQAQSSFAAAKAYQSNARPPAPHIAPPAPTTPAASLDLASNQ